MSCGVKWAMCYCQHNNVMHLSSPGCFGMPCRRDWPVLLCVCCGIIHCTLWLFIDYLLSGGGRMIFHFSIVFLLIEFHGIFSIFYKILTNYVYYYCILIRIVYAIWTSFFFCANFTSFHTHFLLTFFFCYFVLFHSCSLEKWTAYFFEDRVHFTEICA